MIRMLDIVGLSSLNEMNTPAYKGPEGYDDSCDCYPDEIGGSDLKKLRGEGDDHEVSMAGGQLDDIIKNATELKAKIGQGEKDIPAWIQDHISQAQNFINQAATNFHEQESPEVKVNELSPKTSTSYIDKAKKDRANQYQDTYLDPMANKDERDAASKKIDKRTKGIQNANRSIAKTKKPGETWTTSSGRKAKKNQDGTITYSDK